MVKKIKGVFKIIICICVFVAAFLGIKNFFPYERCYFKVIGVNENKAIGRDVINCLGEPLLTTTDEDGHGQYYYDGLIVTCNSRTPNTHVRKIEITSKKHGFGLYNIGVGSPKELVKFAYKNSNAQIVSDKYAEGAYIDNSMYIVFSYDEDGFVKEIYIATNYV